MKCPICGAEMDEKKVDFPISVGKVSTISHIFSHVCANCGYDEDDKRNKKIISDAIHKTLISYSLEIIETWKNENKNFSEIERSFLLPAKTLSKWLNKKTKPSAAAVELIRIIDTFPWMEKIADLGFETNEAKQYVRNYYITEFNDSEKAITYDSTPTEHIYTAVIKKNINTLNNDESFLSPVKYLTTNMR